MPQTDTRPRTDKQTCLNGSNPPGECKMWCSDEITSFWHSDRHTHTHTHKPKPIHPRYAGCSYQLISNHHQLQETWHISLLFVTSGPGTDSTGPGNTRSTALCPGLLWWGRTNLDFPNARDSEWQCHYEAFRVADPSQKAALLINFKETNKTR